MLVWPAVPLVSMEPFTDLTFISVPRVFGHDDSEGAHRQTAFQAVSVPARPVGSQLTREREGDNRS